MAVNFNDIMSKQTDEELITILTVMRSDYTETALMAAQTEADSREIPTERIEQIKEEQTIIKNQKDLIANEPLESDVKIIAIIFPLIARIMYSKKYREGGYERKSAELYNAYFIGRLCYIGLIILIAVIVEAV